MTLKWKGGVAVASLGLALGSQAYAQETGPALTKGQEYMLVTNYPNNLHIIDVASEKLVKTCHMPDAFGPGMVQVSPDRSTAYVLNNHYADIYGIDLDSCRTVFHANLKTRPDEKARALFSLAISPDGKELYSAVNPTRLYNDHFVVQQPRLQVYSTDAGLDAKPIREFPVPRQISIMQTGDDGALYMAGADIYKMDVNTGKREVAVPARNWQRPLYSAPDMLYFWPHQTYDNTFSMLYTAAKFKDESQDMATANYVYGRIRVNLATGETETTDFAPLTEVYFTGLASPKDPNQMFTVLNHLSKHDVAKQELVKQADLEHSYYAVAFNKDADKLFLAGTYNDIAVFDPDNLERKGTIKVPGGDMAITTPQLFVR